MKSVLLLLLISMLTACEHNQNDPALLHHTIQKFYLWVLENGEATQSISPSIVDESNSTRFKVDTIHLPLFKQKMMSSNIFAPSFPEKIENYYANHQAIFNKMSQKEFDEMAKFGRGPMMEVEDMDMFFCAQEFEYTKEFVEKLNIKESHFEGNRAWAIVESTYGWPTKFYFENINQQWLISGYCVFE